MKKNKVNMSKIDNSNGISLSSYSKGEWKSLLAETAYRGFKINKISNRFKAGGECTFENDNLINLISVKGKTTTVNMNKVLKKRDRWSFSRLVHNIRMLFPNSSYATKFNDRISKLAEKLTIDARPKDFHNRCQANLGNFARLPTDIYDQIIYAMPTHTKQDKIECIEHMRMFWKAPLGSEVICGTIDVKKFANWVNKNRCNVFNLNLEDEDLIALFPYLERLHLEAGEFNFDRIDLVRSCNNLKFLEISNSDDFIDDHFQYIFNLPNLKELNISNCSKITDDGLKWITGPNKLASLGFEKCKIMGEGLRSIKKLTNLTDLRIDCELNEDEALKHLSKLTRLKSLTLGCHHITKEGFKHLENIPSLTHLSLSGGFTGDDLEPIGKIRSLKNLTIANPRMTGDGLKHLTESTSLEVLILDRCRTITDDNLQCITQIKNLFFLRVSNCDRLTEENFQKLSISKSWR